MILRRLALAALCSFACGKQTFLAAAFVQTPKVPNPIDPTGANPIPQFQVMTAFFGTIDTTDPTQISADKEAPITDAKVSVSFFEGAEPRVLTVPAAASPAGLYELTSKDEPKLTFDTGVAYTLVLMTSDGDAYGARFVPGPPADIQEFVSSTCTVSVPPVSFSAQRCMNGAANAGLTIHRTDTTGTLLPAFVLVGKINPNNPSAEPQVTYKTVPDSADALLKFVLSDVSYRKASFDIPGSAFPGSGYYLVSLLVAKQGKVSGNAFLGSTALVGSGAAGIVRVP